MIVTLAVEPVEIIVGVIVAIVVLGGFGLYLYRKIKAKKNGGGCCSGDCCSCGGCSVSFKKKEKHEDKED